MPLRTSSPILTLYCLALCLLPQNGCTRAPKPRYDRHQVAKHNPASSVSDLVIGIFPLASPAVIDGDTIAVVGLDTSLRLLAIDTEETYKNERDRRDSELDFAGYLRTKRGDSLHPVKAATPLGEEAKAFGKKFFQGVKQVRLERDHPKEIRGRFNRTLAYVFAQKNGKWVHYNLEAVRAGMTPYFTKYGYSRRFHALFVNAEKEARKHKRGIWKPGCECYQDYQERKTWWNRRAEFIRQFEKEATTHDDFFVLTHWDAKRALEEHVGHYATVLATVVTTKERTKGPSYAILSRRQFQDLPAIFFDKDVFYDSKIADVSGEFVRIRGKVSRYKNPHSKKETLQLIVTRANDVTSSKMETFRPNSLN